jgi:hypothetical protein
LEAGNKQEMNQILRQYKVQGGAPNFPALFNIPRSERIAALAEREPVKTNAIVSGALTMAFENINLKRGFKEEQVLELADAIIDSAGEDNLSLEDLVLFLQYLVRGKYEMSYESLDVPKFMRMFNKYRDERWAEGVRIRDEKHDEYKSLGDRDVFDRSFRKPENSFQQELFNYNTRLQAKNDEIRALREERKRNRDGNNTSEFEG